MIWQKVAYFPQLVILGVFAATLSSALGSVLGAPRYLQALAFDRVVPRLFGKGHGELNEPRLGTIATFVIAEVGILVAELDIIARVITIFFLASYGFIGWASGIQTWSGISSFRPDSDFKIPAWVGFLGAAVCFAIMFKLDMIALLGANVGDAFHLCRAKKTSIPYLHRSPRGLISLQPVVIQGDHNQSEQR